MRCPARLLLAATTLLLGSSAAMGFVRRGDVVLTQDGGIVRIDADAGVMLVVPIATPLHQPTGIAVLPDGDLVIADWALPRMEAGSVVRVRPLDGTVTTLRQGPPLINPFALARGPDGRVVLADIDAGTHVEFPNATLRRGALFDLDPATGGITTLTLKGTTSGSAKIVAKGKGANLSAPATPVGPPVTAFVRRLDAAACWQATFSAPSKNANGTFSAKN